MTSVGYATLQVIPSLKGIDKAISSGMGDTSAAGRRAGDSYSSGFRGALPMLAGAIAAIGFGALAGEAIAASDATDKFKQTLNFAGLKTDTIDALTASTRKYADQTVYDLSDIQNITAQLAANAVPNYDKLAQAAGNLNAVAGGNAVTFKAVGQMLTQTAGAGKLTTENWNQLADAIPGASGLMQAAMLKNGAYTGNFRTAMEKGQITAEEFNQAIMDLGMTDAAKEAATSTATFEGAWGNLKATMVGGLSDVFTKAKPAVTAGMAALAGGISTAMPVVLAGIDAVVAAVTSLTASFSMAAPSMAIMGGALNTTLLPSLSSLATIASTVVIPALAALAAGFATNIIPAISQVILAFQNVALVVVPIVTQLAALVLAKFAEWGPTISIYMTQITQIIGGVLTIIAGIITAVLGQISAFWSTWGGTIMSVVSIAFDTIMTVIGGALNITAGIVKAVTSAMSGDWQGAMDGLSQAAQGGVDMVMGVFNGFVGIAGSILSGAGKAIMDGFLGGLRASWGAVTDFVGGIASWIAANKGPLSYDRRLLQPAGRAIMGGLVDSMAGQMPALESMVGQVTDTLSSAGGSAAYELAGGPTSGAAASVSASASSSSDIVAAALRAALAGAELRLTGAVDTIGDAVAGRILLAYEGAV